MWDGQDGEFELSKLLSDLLCLEEMVEMGDTALS
jgi:hypothetical protein